MDATGDYHVNRSKLGSERQKSHVFSHMWKIDPKDKCIHKYKHDHLERESKKERERENMLSIVGLFKENKEEGEEMEMIENE
jgi:hypothetical protein